MMTKEFVFNCPECLRFTVGRLTKYEIYFSLKKTILSNAPFSKIYTLKLYEISKLVAQPVLSHRTVCYPSVRLHSVPG